MQIRVGYEIVYDCVQPTPMVLMLHVHHSRVADIVVPAGRPRIASSAVVNDAGLPDPIVASARQHAVQDLPDEAMVYLLGSRYCETDRLSETAWAMFGQGPTGWARVQAICDFVHNHITFDYMAARSTDTAWEGLSEK